MPSDLQETVTSFVNLKGVSAIRVIVLKDQQQLTSEVGRRHGDMKSVFGGRFNCKAWECNVMVRAAF